MRLKSYPIPIHEACDSGFYHPSPELLESCGIDINHSFLSGMYNFSDFNVSGNNVTVEMRIRGTTFWPEVVCKGFALWIKCENGVIKQHFNAPGCSYWLNCIYGNVEISGKKQDISFFSIDFSKWRTVKIESEGQIISIYVDGELIHEQEHGLDFGNVVGVSCNFTANGAIDYYYLFNGEGNPVIMENFDYAAN